MKHRTIRKAVPLLVLAVTLLLMVESQLIVVPNPTKLTFQLAGQNVSVTVRQRWSFFDKAGVPMTSDSYSDKTTLSFESLRNPYPIIDQGKLGWIIVKAEFTLENDMPNVLPPDHTEPWPPFFYFLTNHLTGDLSVNGNHRANIQFVPWEKNNQWTQLVTGSEDQASVAFATGDRDGTVRYASFWLLASPDVTLPTCQNYPAACVDLSKDVAALGDFRIAVDFKEDWKAWLIEWPLPLLDPFFNWNAYWNACTYKWKAQPSVGTSCTMLMKTLTPVALHWEAMMSEFCYFTNGTCSVTKSATTVIHVTISQTLTTVDSTLEWIIVRKYSHTTVTDTAIVPSDSQYSSCTNLFTGPLTWLCNSWNTIPYWLIGLGIILLLAFFYAPSPKSGRVGLVLNVLGGRQNNEDL